MVEVDTDPIITKKLIDGLRSWYQGIILLPRSPSMVQQSLLGWESVLDGWLGTEWHLQQAAYWAQWK